MCGKRTKTKIQKVSETYRTFVKITGDVMEKNW